MSTIEAMFRGTAKATWGTARWFADGIYGAAQRAWNVLPERAQTTVKGVWEGSQHKRAVKVATAATAGGVTATAALVAAPIIGAGTLLTTMGATAAGTLATAVMMIALHPNRLLVLNLPGRDDRPPINFATPGENPDNPVRPAESLEAIAEKSVAFKQNHPLKMSAKRLDSRGIEDASKVKALLDQKIITDQQKNKLVENVSAFVSAYFIFENRLGLNLSSHNGVNVVMEMTQAAVERGADGEKLSLWDACISTLEKRGIELSFFQKIQARFWYLLTDSIGIIPNMFSALADKILSQLRGGVQGEKPTAAVSKILSIAGSFLDRYNGAAASYANANRPGFLPLEGDLAHYQKKIIDELGDSASLARAKAEMNPGDDLGKISMQELCKEFVAVIIDDPNIFPSIPFFRGLQQITFLGIRFGIVFDWLEWVLGGLINWIVKKMIKGYAPDFVQSLVQRGVEQTMPGNYSFKIALATSLKEQVDELKKELENGIPSARLRFEENRQLTETIAKLIKTLELRTCHGDQFSLRRKIEELDHPSDEALEMEKLLHSLTLKGAQLLIHHYTQNPDAIEELFGKIFKLCADPFQSGAPVYTEANYEAAVNGLKDSLNRLIKAQVEEGVREKVVGETEEYINTVLDGKRLDLTDEVERLRKDANNNPLYPNPQPENLPYQLDKTGKNPVYKGLFREQKEKADAIAQVLKGLSLKMMKEIHADTNGARLSLPADTPRTEAVIAAETRFEAGKTALNQAVEAVKAIESGASPDQIQLIHAKNRQKQAQLECNIAAEEFRILQHIAKLEAQITAVQAEEESDDRQSKLEALQTQRDLAAEELSLVPSMEEFNGLESENNHLLKNLDNYMKSIEEFTEHLKSLNIDLYSEQIQNLFYRTFGPIYQQLVPLTEQLITLQKWGKSYDKLKRLSKQFVDIGDKSRQNPSNLLDVLNEKARIIKDIDNSFDNYESNPGVYVTPFENDIAEFKTLSKEYQEQIDILNKIRELGSLHKLSYALLENPKETIEAIRSKIPAEDHGPLFAAIERLEEKAGQSPVPNLDLDREAVEEQFHVIVQKYQQKRHDKGELKRQKREDIATWGERLKGELDTARNQMRSQFLNGLKKLKTDTDLLAENIKNAKLSSVDFLARNFRANWIVNRQAAPIIDKVNRLTDATYEFITSSEIAKATARLTFGEYIRTHRKSPEPSLLARLVW